MGQVAGIVVGRAERQRADRSDQWALGQELDHVTHPAGEGRGALGPGGIALQEVPVALEMSTAPGRVDEHGLHPRRLEDRDVLAREQALALCDIERKRGHAASRVGDLAVAKLDLLLGEGGGGEQRDCDGSQQ